MRWQDTIRTAGTALLVTLAVRPPVCPQSFRSSGSTTLAITVGAEASISVANSTTEFSGTFSTLTGTTNLRYKTSNGSGTGAITVQVTRDSSRANGSSPAPANSNSHPLTYTCKVAEAGMVCGGTQTTSSELATPVASFGGSGPSQPEGNSASLDWMLAHDSSLTSGEYKATVTFTISAT